MRRVALLLLFALAGITSLAQTAVVDPPYGVGGDVKAPLMIRHVEPIYPPEAKENRIAGSVMTEVLVDYKGDVVHVRVLKPLPYGLDQVTVDAVRQWKFRPGTLYGEAVDVFFPVTVNFKLDGSTVTVFGGGGIIGSRPVPRASLTMVILIRHAESGPASADDPVLTAEGQQRAERLARMFGNTPISAIYTTPSARTRGTAAPLGAARALTPVEVTVTPTYGRDIVATLREQRGGTFVVVGRSDTTLDLLRAFGVSDLPEIPETAYDNLFILTFGRSTEPRLLSLKY